MSKSKFKVWVQIEEEIDGGDDYENYEPQEFADFETYDEAENYVSELSGAGELTISLLALRKGLLDMINGGRLSESDIPDDWQWLNQALQLPD